jgi:integrase
MRSGVMLALLALCPVRLKNFAALTLGTSFCRVGERWWIVLGRGETKGGRADERFVPAELNGAIALYLTWARPVLLGAGAFTIGGVEAGTADPFVSGPLWVGENGGSLGYSGVERAVMDTKRLALGVALGPHDFRRAAAVTASVQAGPTPHLASALLQHTDVQVTQEHYNRASSLSAAEAYARLVEGLGR